MDSLRSLLEEQPRPANYAQVLNAASSFKSLMQEPDLQRQVLAGLNDPNPEVQRAAVQISLEHFLSDPQTAALVKTAFANLNTSGLTILMEEVGDPKFMSRHLGVAGGAVSQDQKYFLGKKLVAVKRPISLDNPIVLDTVLASLHNPDSNVRAASLDVLRQVKNVEQRPDFHAAMEQLQNSSNPRLKLIATSVLQGKKLSEALKDVQPGSVLDFNYFVTKIEPILATPGADGKACVFCHASHVIFKLRPPNAAGVFSATRQRRELQVCDARRGHQQSDAEPGPDQADQTHRQRGNVGDYLATHNGGQRWHGNESAGNIKQSWNGFEVAGWKPQR